jgi:hypothetical protein
MDELEAHRRDAIRLLSGAVAADRLPVDQLEARLALVRQATNRATLDAITADLLPSGGYSAAPLPLDPATLAPVAPADRLSLTTVLSSSKRAGSWTVPLALEVRVRLGELTIDLRDAVFCADALDLDLDILLGSFTLIVPAGAQVENECEERWSSTTHSTRSTRGASPLGLLIRIRGRVRWSSVEIKEKRRSGEEPERGLRKLLPG